MDPTWLQFWSTVYNVGPKLNQHWASVCRICCGRPTLFKMQGPTSALGHRKYKRIGLQHFIPDNCHVNAETDNAVAYFNAL